MTRRRRIIIALASICALVVIALGTVWVFSQTDWGRERVRRYVENMLNDKSHGIVRIGRVSGNLLKGFTLHNVSITDSAGAPFIKADEIWSRYSLRTLLGQRIDMSDVRLVRPVIVLNRLPGGKWNYDRIFPQDTITDEGIKEKGWGTWIRFSDVTMLDGNFTIKSPWEPDPALRAAELQDAILKAFGPEGRLRVERVSGGFQKVSEFQKINASLPLVRLSHPNYKTKLLNISALRMIALPMRPPPVVVRGVNGTIEFTGDSVWWKGLRVGLANSNLAGDGKYTFEGDGMRLRLRASPVGSTDLRWIHPELPEGGSGTMDFAMDWIGDTSIYIARNADVKIGGARLRGDFGITIRDTIALHNTNLRFANLDTRLIERIFPSVESPRSGILNGSARLGGGTRAMRVNGDVAFDDRETGRSRVAANGTVGFRDGVFNARDLRLRMLPVQFALLESLIDTDMPIGGVLTGNATLNGASNSQFSVVGDVTHVEGRGGSGSRSRLVGRGAFRPGNTPWLDVDADLLPLSLVTAGKFAPALGLRGTARGPLRLTGNTRNLAINSSLTFNDGGSLDVQGTLDLASRTKGYNIDATATLFNANAIMARAPRMSATGVMHADGRGFDPATMRANIFADLRGSTYDSVTINAATVRVAIANGMANVDTAHVDLPQGLVDVSGTFGMAPGRSGELRYAVRIDSLSAIAPFVPGLDTGVTQPRPRILAKRVTQARADSAQIERRTEVERIVTGKAPPMLVVDTPQVISRNRLEGSLQAQGVATGNIRNFSLNGTANGANIVARGNVIDTVSAQYSWINARTPSSKMDVRARVAGVTAGGFALDSAYAVLSYGKPNGSAQIVVYQEKGIAYNANANFILNNDRNQLLLNTMRLQFDTTVWASTQASTIHWNKSGIDIDDLELRDQFGGRIFVDGRLPREGSANLHIAADRFEIANAIAIAQSDIDARGLVSLDFQLSGTAADPTFRGAFGGEGLIYNGTSFPEVHGTVNYDHETLTGFAEAVREDGRRLLLAEGTIPINLALTGVTGSRIPTNRQIALNVDADSLPLHALPDMTDFLANLRGEARGQVRITGTLDRPTITGNFTLADARAKVVPLGITVNEINASIRMMADTVLVDSIVGYSSGRIAITGGVGIGSLREPSFDLRLTTNNARVLDNDRGELRADARIAMAGPFKDVYVSGDVRIREGVVYLPEDDNKKVIGAGDPALFNVLDTAVLENKEIFPTQSPLLANMRMDVNLSVDRGVFVRSTDANVEVYSDGDLIVRVNNAKETLILDGVLLSERGMYTFMSKRFEVKRGSATFINTNRINPTLQATGEYEVRLPSREAVIIRIVIGGTLENLQIALESDAQPPISQSDLLSYLAFGRSSATLLQIEGTSLTAGSAGSGNLVGQGAALATRQLAGVALGVFADELAGEAARSLGADVFTITPADVQPDIGGFLRGTEFEFGKYLNTNTFISINSRLDPATLKRPGFTLQHWFGGRRGYRVETGLSSRYLLRAPSLTPEEPQTSSVFGLFLIREWRY